MKKILVMKKDNFDEVIICMNKYCLEYILIVNMLDMVGKY